MVTNIIKLIFFIRDFVLNHLIIFSVFLFLFIPFIPRFDSIDIIGPQWLIFSILALLFLFLFGLKSLKDKIYISFLYKDKALRLFIVFIFFSIISLFNSTNISLSIVELSRFFSVFISIYFFIFFLYKRGQYLINIVLILISIHLFLELIFCYFPLFTEILNTGSFSATVSQKDFAGIAGNKNIAASSIAIKIPIIIYLLIKSNNFIKRLLFSFLLFFALITLLFLNTRSVFVSTSFVLLLTSVFFIFNFRKHCSSFLMVCIALFAAFYLNISSRISSSQNSFERLKSIDVSYEGSSGRFELWSNALDYISKNPFFGCGIG
jgi:O-antigen ligase